MEKRLVKGGIYSFIVGLLLGVLLIPISNTIHSGAGFITEIYDSVGVIIYKLIRFASFVTVITLLSILAKEYVLNTQSAQKAFARGFLRGFLIVAGIIVVLIGIMIAISIN